MTDTPLSDDVVERVAAAIYESIFVDEWTGGNGVEAAQYRQAARAALEAARYGELERYLNESRPYLEAFRLKEAGQALMGEIDRMPVRQLCKRADALLSSIGASQP